MIQANTKTPPPIFILGAPRSGTTLITQALSQHSDVFIFNESLLYDFIVANELYGELSKAQQNSLYEHLSSRIDARVADGEGQTEFGCRFTLQEAELVKQKFQQKLSEGTDSLTAAQIFDSFMTEVAVSKGKVIWGDKTPNHVFHLDRILQDFPEAKFLYIVRDPRDFLLSYKFSWRQKGSRQEVAKLYHPLVTSFLWRRSEQALQKFYAQHASNVILIRYEDLVNNPKNGLSAVFAFLDIADHSASILVQGSNSSFAAKTEQLSRTEQSVCTSVCHDFMLAHGYSVSGSRVVGLVNVGLSVFTLPLFLWNALPVVSRHFQGGFLLYLKARGLWG